MDNSGEFTLVWGKGLTTICFDSPPLSGPWVLRQEEADRIRRAVDKGFDPDEDDSEDYDIGGIWPAID